LVPLLHARRIPCILDMLDVQWQVYKETLSQRRIPSLWKRWALARYRRREERAWQQFDGLVAINRAEHDYVRSVLPGEIQLFHAPMGIDLAAWPYCWTPSQPPRLAYYGGLHGVRNQRQAWTCFQSIMPEIWRKMPCAELWLVGNGPPADLR